MVVADHVLKKILETAARIRVAELEIAEHYPEKTMRCPTHLCLGQEIIGAAFGAFAARDDVFIGNYRSHGHYLAKGGDLFRLYAELLGKKEGCAGGLGGSMHLVDVAARFYGSSAIVAAVVPIAAGVAFAQKRRGRGECTVVFFGDAAVEEGIVTETVNFSLLHKLPIIFVCENNRLCVTTPLEQRTPRLDLYRRFEPYGLPGTRLEAHEPLALAEAAEAAYRNVRAGLGPQYLEVQTERWATHVGHEFTGPVHGWWQNPHATENARCPIAWLGRILLERGAVTREELAALHLAFKTEISGAFKRAGALPDPDPRADLTRAVYASPLLSTLPSGISSSTNHIRAAYVEPVKLVNPF